MSLGLTLSRGVTFSGLSHPPKNTTSMTPVISARMVMLFILVTSGVLKFLFMLIRLVILESKVYAEFDRPHLGDIVIINPYGYWVETCTYIWVHAGVAC